jgi:hypothetical protein
MADVRAEARDHAFAIACIEAGEVTLDQLFGFGA